MSTVKHIRVAKTALPRTGRALDAVTGSKGQTIITGGSGGSGSGVTDHSDLTGLVSSVDSYLSTEKYIHLTAAKLKEINDSIEKGGRITYVNGYLLYDNAKVKAGFADEFPDTVTTKKTFTAGITSTDIEATNHLKTKTAEVIGNTKTKSLDVAEKTTTNTLDVAVLTKSAAVEVAGETKTNTLVASGLAKAGSAEIAGMTKSGNIEVANNAKTKDLEVSELARIRDLVVTRLAEVLNLSVTDTATLAKTIVKESIGTGTFIPGFTGEGFKIWKLAAGWNLEIDTLTIRKTLTAFELLISKIRSVNGALAITQGNGKIKNVLDQTTVYAIEIEDTMSFVSGDLVRCQTWQSAGSKYYWVTVTRVEGNSIICNKSEFNGIVPAAGDELVQMGNVSNTARQSMIYLDASSGRPSIDVLSGINTKSFDGKLKVRLGCLDGITDTDFPSNMQPSGDGIYCTNGFFKGMFVLRSGKTVEDYTGEAVDAIQIGVRNLVKNSAVNETSNMYGFGKRYLTKDLEPGKTYTFVANGRVDQQALDDNKYLGVYLYEGTYYQQKVLVFNSLVNETKQVTFTLSDTLPAPTNVMSYLHPLGGNRTGNVTVNWYMLIEGNKVPDSWIEAPEDTVERIQEAKDAADAAQGDANTAKATADTAATNAATANALLSDIASDSKLTPSEKQETKKEWDIIISEKVKNVASATTYAVSSTVYTAACTTLGSYLTPLIGNLSTTSDIVGATFRTNFKAYYDARTDLLNAISSKAKELADKAQLDATTAGTVASSAQRAADKAQGDAHTAKGVADAATTRLNNWAADGTISPVEKLALKQEQKALTDEKTQIVADAVKYVVSSTAYVTAFTNYNAELTYHTTATPENIVIRASFAANQTAYYAAKQAVLNAIATAAKKLATDAQTAANTANRAVERIDTELSVLPGTITAAVTKTTTEYTDNKIAGIQIGGRNLIKNSKTILSSISDNPYTLSVMPLGEPIKSNTTYTISVEKTDIVIGEATNFFTVITYSASINKDYTNIKIPISQNKQQGQFTTPEIPEGCVLLLYSGLVGNAQNRQLRWTNLKLEEGNKATAWTPAPEDTDAVISNMEARFEIREGQISSKVTEVTRKATEAAGSATAAGNSASSAASSAGTATGKAGEAAKSYQDVVTKQGEINTTAGKITLQVTEVTEKSAAAINAAELAAAMSKGKMLYRDPIFKSGRNGIIPYNISGNPNLTITRGSGLAGNPNTSGYHLQITTAGAVVPGLGGFTFATPSRANAIFVTRFIAKLPVGYAMWFTHNAMGNGSSFKWLTSSVGTGNWEEYAVKVKCGSTGVFNATNYIYISEGVAPLTWYLAYATVFDTTDVDDVPTRDEIKSGIEIVPGGMKVFGENHDFSGKFTFSSFSQEAQSTINGKATTEYVDTAKEAAITAARNNVAAKLGYVDYADMEAEALAGQTIITGGKIRTSLIDTDVLIAKKLASVTGTIGGFNITANSLYAGTLFPGNGIGIIKTDEAGCFITSRGGNDYCMLYNYNAGAWGLIGRTGSAEVFHLGSRNQIAGWTFDNEALYTGVKAAPDVYSTDGITLRNNGSISSKNFRITASGDVFGQNCTFENGTFTGKVTATKGTIGGFEISENNLLASKGMSLNEDGVIFSGSNIYAALGISSGPSVMGLDVPLWIENSGGADTSIAAYFSATGAHNSYNNIAISIAAGCISGLAFKVRKVEYSQKLRTDDTYVSCYNTSNMILDLPTGISIGKVLFVKLINNVRVDIRASSEIIKLDSAFSIYNIAIYGATMMLVWDGQFWCANRLTW